MRINSTRLSLTPPAPFDFERTAYSHGWVVLEPNGWDKERRALRRVERLGSGKVVALDIRGAGSVDKPRIRVDASHAGDLSRQERKEIRTAAARMFRVDEDLTEFYALCKKRGEPWKKMTGGLGRLLGSPTVFEDAVKVICTTNIQWGGTKRMVAELVRAFGAAFDGDGALRAFPTPEAVAAAPLAKFTKAVNLGYRGPYVHELASRIAAGDLDLEALRGSDLPTPELRKELLAIKGVGSYAAASMLMLLGRYDELAVDTVFRQFVREKYFDGGSPTDAQAMAVYEDWAEWKYLAYWFDIWDGFDEEL